MTSDYVVEKLKAKFPEIVEWIEADAGQSFAVVDAEDWLSVCRYLSRSAELEFDFLRSMAGTDFPELDAIEVVCHLYSYKNKQDFVIKTRAQKAKPQLDSLSKIWPAANWYEREIFDLLGVHFDEHPDLRRILLPEDWVGHPLLKDYTQQESYKGIPTTRPGY